MNSLLFCSYSERVYIFSPQLRFSSQFSIYNLYTKASFTSLICLARCVLLLISSVSDNRNKVSLTHADALWCIIGMSFNVCFHRFFSILNFDNMAWHRCFIVDLVPCSFLHSKCLFCLDCLDDWFDIWD